MEINQDALLDAADISGLLRKKCEQFGSQKALAEYFGVSPQYLGAVINAQRPPSKMILKSLGIRRVVTVRYLSIGSEA